MSNIKAKRLNDLLDATIKNYYIGINPDNSLSLYDAMYEHLLNGDLDNFFLAPKLDDVSIEQKKEVFDLARKYGYLCFYDGDVSMWLDSTEGIIDEDISSQIILDNYNFLLEVALENGEDSLKEMSIFQNSDMAKESAVVEYLRNTFGNDEALKLCLKETSDKFGQYADISNEDKYILYTFPHGVLYREEKGKLIMNPEENIIDYMAIELGNFHIKDLTNLDQVSKYLQKNDFDDGIRDICEVYMDNKYDKYTNLGNKIRK